MYTLDTLPELWNEYAPVYEKLLAAPVFRNLAKTLYSSIVPIPKCSVHDGGCGISYHLKNILDTTKAARVIATDFSPEMLHRSEIKLQSLPVDDQQKVTFKHIDLAKDWPEGKFDIQIFQLVANYLPAKGWQRIIEQSAVTMNKGGYLYSCTLLKGMSVKQLSRGHIFGEIVHTPLASFPAMLKSTKIMGNFDRLTVEGKIQLPAKEEYLDFHKNVGFKTVEIVGTIFWGAGIITRAQI